MAGVLAGILVVVVLGFGGFLLFGGDEADPAAAGTQTASTAAASPTAPTSAPTPTAKQKPAARKSIPQPLATGPGDVRNQPSGLFCRDLNARDYSYAAAVDYWRVHGQPNQMDADRNGIPCETVYSPGDVSSYWSTRELPPVVSSSIGYLPSGLFCRDLMARGVSYPDAVSYWWQEGSPDRMDAERNGIPCETVYPAYDIASFW